MRPIDADALMDNIKLDTKKAIEEDDKVGSFWLGYFAGSVIKQPTIQSELDLKTLIRTIETGITATNTNDAYSLGMRNGMKWCKSLIDGVEPEFEDVVADVKELPPVQPVATDTNVGDTISRQAAIDAIEKNACNTQRIMDAVNNLPPAQPEPTDIDAREAVYNLAEKIGIHQLFALTVELRGEPIQPEPHEGHWIEGKIYRDVIECNCSECGQLMTTAATVRMNYCPHCGADMRGEKDG